MHPLTWQRAGQSDDKLREFLLPALVDLGASVIIQDARHDYLLVANLPEVWLPDGWESGTLASPTDSSLFGAEVAARLTSLKAEMLEAGQKG